MAHTTKIPAYWKTDPLFKVAKQAPKPDMRLTPGGMMAAMTKEPVINCLLYKRPDGSYYVKMQLRSHVKPDRLLSSQVELTGRDMRDAGFRIGVVCGAMAERLCESYGDSFDCEKAARLGEEQFKIVIDALNKGKIQASVRNAEIGG